MSNQFAIWIERQGYQEIAWENFCVDVEFKSKNNLCRVELKVCGEGKPLWSIREALGQLLEYNFYGNREGAQYWFIVLDEKPDLWDFDFVEALRNTHNLPVWLGWQDSSNFLLEKNP